MFTELYVKELTNQHIDKCMEIYLEGCSAKALSWLSLKGGMGNGGFYILFRLFCTICILKKKRVQSIFTTMKKQWCLSPFLEKNDKCNNDVTSWKMLMGPFHMT